VTRLGYLRNRGWTRLEVVIGTLAVSFFVVAGVLLITKGTGSWATLIGCALGVVLGLLRYRAERKTTSRNADDRNE
jgi:membrane associated rhomboid family serine protease